MGKQKKRFSESSTRYQACHGRDDRRRSIYSNVIKKDLCICMRSDYTVACPSSK